MIPILYDYTETEFASNGIGRLVDCIRCTVTEERNGQYECEFVYPITGRYYSEITEGRIIACTHDDDGAVQPFVIYRRTAPLDGQVTFNARHLSYRLSNVIVNPFTEGNVSSVLAGLVSNAIDTNPFSFWTDKSTTAAFTVSVPSSVRSLLGGVEGSILDVFGGEWEFDKWTVKLHGNRGTNRHVTIRYGKNMSDINQVIDGSGLYNALVPYWAAEVDGVQVLAMLPEKIVAATGVTDPRPVVMDLSAEFAEQPTEAQLRAYAQQYLADHQPWIPSENITVDFIQLWQTTDYASVANLQKVRLCDTVDVLYPALGVTATGIKVIKTVYNVLADRYDSMELGQPQVTFGETLTADIGKEVKKATAGIQTMFDAAISAATDLITGGQGGHLIIGRDVNGYPNELLIMDTDSVLTATNILRINQNGIGFSTNGGATYSTAWTISGQFVADYITTGTLRAIMIQGPNADTFWNLTSGEWKSHGLMQDVYYEGGDSSGTSDYGEWDIGVTVDIKDGAYTLVGTHENTASYSEEVPEKETTYIRFGIDASLVPAALTMGFMSFYYWQEPYANPDFIVSGDRIKVDGMLYGDYEGEDYWETGLGIDTYFTPASYLTPTALILGQADDLTETWDPDDAHVPESDDDGGFNLVPQFNKLQLIAGAVNVEDSIIFEENVVFKTVADGEGGSIFTPAYRHDMGTGIVLEGAEAYYYRPTWPFKPGDKTNKTQTGDTYKIVCPGYLTDSKASIYFTIPLVRPVSEYVRTITISSASCKIRQGGSYILGDGSNTVNIASNNYAKVIRWSDHGLTVRLKKSSGNFSGTNNDLVMVDLLGLQLSFS